MKIEAKHIHLIGICGTAIPRSDQVAARSSRAMAPRNFRVRMVITELSGDELACAGEGADYKGFENPFKLTSQWPPFSHDKPRITAQCASGCLSWPA